MSTIQSLGIGSGLEIDSIVSALVDAEKVPKEQALNQREEVTTAKISAFGEIQSRLSSFQTSASALRLNSSFNQKTADSSDASAFTATASSLAETGQYSVEVQTLASAQSIATDAFSSVDDVIGTGELTVRFGTTTIETDPPSYDFAQDTTAQEQTITIDGNNNTVSSFKDHINNNDYGFSASIVNDGSGFRLVLTAESGVNNSLQISATSDGDGDATDALGLSQLTFDDTQQNLTQNVQAQDATLSINGIPITSESNTVNNAVNGLTLELQGATTGPKSLSVASDTSDVKEQVTSLVESYNEFISYTSELTAYSGATGEASLLLGDSTVRTIVSQIRSTMFSQVQGVGTGLQALSNIGILSTQADGTLEFNEQSFDTALQDQGDQFQALFSTSGSASDANIQYVSGSSFTKEGTYDIKITELASRGTFAANPVLVDFAGGQSIDIDADNENFEVRVDGFDSGPLQIPRGNYTSGEALATVIQNQINGATNIDESGGRVTVTYNQASNNFAFESGSYGTNSGITFSNVGPNSATELGIFNGTGTSGTNVAGTINGVEGTGEGQFLSVNSGDAQGLKIGVLGGAASSPDGESRGSLTFSRGIADKLNSVLEGFLEPSDGFLSTRLEGLETTLDRITVDKEALDLTVERLEVRLLAQFNAIDGVVGELNNLGSFLTSALASLPGAKKSDS